MPDLCYWYSTEWIFFQPSIDNSVEPLRRVVGWPPSLQVKTEVPRPTTNIIPLYPKSALSSITFLL